MTIRQLTAREWIERAKETLDERTREIDDMQMLDAFDDICTALEIWPDNSQHWIVRVQDSINGYKEIQSAYFDGSESDAKEYFASDKCKAVSRYIGNMRYQITMQANPVCIQYPE